MTPLTKAVHRVVVIEDQEYIASLVPATENQPAAFTLRKKKHRSLSSWIAMDDSLVDHAENKEAEAEYEPITQAERSAQHVAKQVGIQLALDNARENDPIHPKDLEMWSKYSYPKFLDAWARYKTALAFHKDPELIKIVWGKDNEIVVYCPEFA